MDKKRIIRFYLTILIFTLTTVPFFQCAEIKPTPIEIKHFSNITSIALSPNGKYLACGINPINIKLLDIQKSQELGNFTSDSLRFESLLFSPNSQILASVDEDLSVKLWGIRKMKKIRDLQEPISIRRYPSILSFSPDGQILVSTKKGQYSRRINLWDVKSGRKLYHLNKYLDKQSNRLENYKHYKRTNILFSPNGKILYCLMNFGPNESYPDDPYDKYHHAKYTYGILVWDMKKRKILNEYSIYHKNIALSPDGKILIGINAFRRRGIIYFYNVKNNKLIIYKKITFKNYARFWSYINLSFSPNGQFFAIAIKDEKIIRLWDVKKGKEVKVFKGHSLRAKDIHFSPNGKVLAAIGSDDRSVKFWDLKSGKLLAKLYVTKTNEWVLTTPKKFFDGSKKGIKEVYFEKDVEEIENTNLYKKYHRPNLLRTIFK